MLVDPCGMLWVCPRMSEVVGRSGVVRDLYHLRLNRVSKTPGMDGVMDGATKTWTYHIWTGDGPDGMDGWMDGEGERWWVHWGHGD